MTLAEAQVGQIVRFKNRQALVVGRFSEDRSSGGTDLAFFDAKGYVTAEETIFWDHQNPEVEVVGKGRMRVQMEMSQAKTDIAIEPLGGAISGPLFGN